MVVGARALFGEAAAAIGIVSVQVNAVNDDEAVGEAQGGFNGVGEALAHALAHDEAVDDHLDGVLELLVERGHVPQSVDDAVDPHAREAPGGKVCEELGVLALAAAHDGGQDLEAGALVHGAHPVDDLLGGL